jgi:ketosteroid isomerase-like protein
MSFEQTLEKHLQALREKNIDAFLETVPQTGEFSLILPNGKLLNTAEEFVEFNQDWFGDPDWSMKIDIVRQMVGEEIGFALLDVIYSDRDREGKAIQKSFYLNLIFQRDASGQWLLTHDQNTDKSV